MSNIDRAVEANDARMIDQLSEDDPVDSQCCMCHEEYYSGDDSQQTSDLIEGYRKFLQISGNMAGKDICRKCLVEHHIRLLSDVELADAKSLLEFI